MPAAVETAVFSNTPAWHGLGTVLDTEGERGLTVEVALKESGIDWEVEKVPSFGLARKLKITDLDTFRNKDPNMTVKLKDLIVADGRFNVQRVTDGRILGNVGSTWEPVQNAEGFQIIQDVIEQAGGTCWIEAAGALDQGSRVWVLAHIDTGLQIAGEAYASYLLFTNGHNGRTSVTAAAVDMRVVCANTLDFALGEAKSTGRIVRVRHTVKAAERIKEAHTILGMRNTTAEELARQGEWLADSKLDDGEFNDFLETLMPVPDGQEGKPAETMITKRRDVVRGIYLEAPNLEPIRGTWWGALQSVLEFSDHRREFKTPESRLKAAWGLTNQALKQQAHDLAVTMALVN